MGNCKHHRGVTMDVWTDTAYRSKKNEAWLEKPDYFSEIHHKKPKRPANERGDGTGQWPALNNPRLRRGRLREQKSRMGLFVRTIGIAGQDKDRHGQSRLQPHALRLARGANCVRMTAKSVRSTATGRIGRPAQR